MRETTSPPRAGSVLDAPACHISYARILTTRSGAWVMGSADNLQHAPARPGEAGSAARAVVRAPLLAAFATLAFALVDLGSTPALHGDEAWVLLRILGFEWPHLPFAGMNAYTGPAWLLLLWPIVAIAGPSTLVLRLTAALVQACSSALLVDVARRAFGVQWTSPWRVLLLCSAPFAVCYGRFGVELTTVVPLLLLGGVRLLVVSPRSGRRARWLWALGGLLLGLACYTHILAVMLVGAGAASAALRGAGLRALVERWRLALLGGVIGIAPSLWMLGSGAGGSGFELGLAAIQRRSWVDALLGAPAMFEGVLDGWIVFLQFCGELRVPVLPWVSVALLALLVLCARDGGLRVLREDLALAAFALFGTIGIALVAPSPHPRYLLVPATVALVLLVRLQQRLGQSGSARMRGFARAVLPLLVCLQVAQLGVNFFWTYREHQGVPLVVEARGNVQVSANEFIETAELRAQLADQGVVAVLGAPLLVWTLLHEDLVAQRFALGELPPGQLPPTDPRLASVKTAIVYYNGDNLWAGQLYDFTNIERIAGSQRSFVRDRRFDARFAVFVAAASGW
ncbi:MAG: glycosyltransferase family 39 protein [Pseudomonadota bacterium]